MNRAVVDVFKMVIGGKSDRWYLVANYAYMVNVVKNCKRGLITDLEAIKALCTLADDNYGKACYFVTKTTFDRITKEWRM